MTQAGAAVYNPHAYAPLARLYAFDYRTAASHMVLLQGTMIGADDNPGGDDAALPEALITEETATYFHLRPHDVLHVAQAGAVQHQFTARVVGVWRPRDAADPYWNGISFEASENPNSPPVYPILISRADYLAGLHAFSGFITFCDWVYTIPPQRLTTDRLAPVGDAITALTSDINVTLPTIQTVTHPNVETGFTLLRTDVEQQEALLNLALAIVAAQIIVLLLLLLASLAELLVASHGHELAILRSRGLSRGQIAGTFLLMGLPIAVVCAILGPPLALRLCLLLTSTALSPATLQHTGINSGPSAVALAAFVSQRAARVPAALMSLAVLTVLVLRAVRGGTLNILDFRRDQARESRYLVWQRYYLDVALALLCAIGYVELSVFGGSSTRLALSGASSPLLLIAPALLLLAGALLLLRLVPLVAKAGARWASRGRGLSLMLAAAHIERTPSRYLRLTMFLTLAAGLGVFVLLFNASLAQNIRDRAAYASGADVRVTAISPIAWQGVGRVMATLEALPRVHTVAAVYRGYVYVSQGQNESSEQLLAVDPQTFGDVVQDTSWRDSFADQSLSALLAGLQAPAHAAQTGPAGQALPAIVSAGFAAQNHLSVGRVFVLELPDAEDGQATFVVTGIVREFPTLYPSQSPGGFVVVDRTAYANLVATMTGDSDEQPGASEFWIQVDKPIGAAGAANQAPEPSALLQALQEHGGSIGIADTIVLHEKLAAQEDSPANAGMRGLLLFGAAIAVLLAILGGLAQFAFVLRQSAQRFVILRTLGAHPRELLRLLLSEQVMIFGLGVVGGSLLGFLMTVITLPYLQFSAATVDPAKLGVPPYQLVSAPVELLALYGAFVLGLVLVALLALRAVMSVAINRALRIAEN